MKKNNRTWIVHTMLYLCAIGISIFLLFFFVTATWIGYEVKRECQDATWAHPDKQDCVEALNAVLLDENQSFRKRNNAIWALGQLGDSRALPTLQSFYTANIPTREPLNGTISQYELKKAINLTSGGINITAWVWRGMANGN